MAGALAPLRRRRAHAAGRSTRTRVTSRRPRGASATRSRRSQWARFASAQAVFLTSHFEALQPRWLESSHRLATAYLHGRPGTTGYPEFDRAFERVRAAPGSARAYPGDARRDARPRRSRRVSIAERGAIGSPSGSTSSTSRSSRRSVANGRARRSGSPRTRSSSARSRRTGRLGRGTRAEAGQGPGRARRRAATQSSGDVPELHVLLTGPARGYVRRELERLGDPVRHVLAREPRRARAGVPRARRVRRRVAPGGRAEGACSSRWRRESRSSRPASARLRSSSSDGANGWLVDVDDVEALADWTVRIRSGVAPQIVEAGRATAEQYALERLDPAWAALLAGFVERTSS